MSEYYKILMWRCHNLFQLLSLWPWQRSRTQTQLGTCLGWLSKTYLWERFDSFWMNPQIISFCLIDQSFNVLYWYPRLIVMKLVVWQHQARPRLKFTRRQLRLLNLYRKQQKYTIWDPESWVFTSRQAVCTSFAKFSLTPHCGPEARRTNEDTKSWNVAHLA